MSREEAGSSLISRLSSGANDGRINTSGGTSGPPFWNAKPKETSAMIMNNCQ